MCDPATRSTRRCSDEGLTFSPLASAGVSQPGLHSVEGLGFWVLERKVLTSEAMSLVGFLVLLSEATSWQYSRVHSVHGSLVQGLHSASSAYPLPTVALLDLPYTVLYIDGE